MKQRYVFYVENLIYWCLNNPKKWHRDGDLPSYYFFANGKLYSTHYYQHGILHRATGPAYIHYNSKTKKYIYKGRKYASLEEMLMMEACK